MAIAEKATGNYYYSNNSSNIPKILTKKNCFGCIILKLIEECLALTQTQIHKNQPLRLS